MRGRYLLRFVWANLVERGLAPPTGRSGTGPYEMGDGFCVRRRGGSVTRLSGFGRVPRKAAGAAHWVARRFPAVPTWAPESGAAEKSLSLQSLISTTLKTPDHPAWADTSRRSPAEPPDPPTPRGHIPRPPGIPPPWRSWRRGGRPQRRWCAPVRSPNCGLLQNTHPVCSWSRTGGS